MNKWRSKWQKLVALAIAILMTTITSKVVAQVQSNEQLPPLQAHSLPQSLATSQNKIGAGDYFAQIESTPLGYLIWTEFPVKVYLDKPSKIENTAANKRFQQWVKAVKKAITEWNAYLPLAEIAEPEKADIIIRRSQPEREVKLNPDTGLYDIPRAVTAETNYQFYLKNNPSVVAHRMTIQVSPNFVGISLLATIRHELGHALGIWGHSPDSGDALYFAQVSDPQPISPRDINTLRRIYQQPTRLGWKIKSDYSANPMKK